MPSQRLPSGHTGREDQRFPRKLRIRKRSEYVRIQQGARGRKTPHFILLSSPPKTTHTRLGVTVSRRVGNAVERNRVKRRVREFFRLHRNKLQPAADLVVIARTGAQELSFQDVAKELAVALGIDADDRRR